MISSQTLDHDEITFNLPFRGYKIINEIDKGSTCVAFQVEDLNTGKTYCAKVIAAYALKNGIEDVRTEIEILTTFNHPNILKVHDYFVFKDYLDRDLIVIITNYCKNGSLIDNILSDKLTFAQKMKITQSFLSAIQYLHSNNIAHCDLKPDNVILDSEFNPIICDFGLSRLNDIENNNSKIKSGSFFYSAPELFEDGPFDAIKADIYAIGIFLYAVFEQQFPYKDGSRNYIVQQIRYHQFNFKSDMNPTLKELIQKCTQYNPNDRITIDQIIEDEFFSEKIECTINCNDKYKNNELFEIELDFYDTSINYL